MFLNEAELSEDTIHALMKKGNLSDELYLSPHKEYYFNDEQGNPKKHIVDALFKYNDIQKIYMFNKIYSKDNSNTKYRTFITVLKRKISLGIQTDDCKKAIRYFKW